MGAREDSGERGTESPRGKCGRWGLYKGRTEAGEILWKLRKNA